MVAEQLVVVLGIPVNKAGQFLLTQRNSPDYPDVHLKWQQAGGCVEYGESPDAAVQRELQEEINATSTILFPYPIVQSHTWDAKPGGHKNSNHVILLGYVVSVSFNNDTHTLDEETHSMQWFSLEEALQLSCLPNTKEFLRQAQYLIDKEQLLTLIK